MNTRQLIAAVLTLTATTFALADQDLTRTQACKNGTDPVSAQQSAQKTGADGAVRSVGASTRSMRGQRAGE
ncbi:MAG TPA: hypothetical protein VF472_15445 [Burkholderiaceae bacterium]